jgi:flagellar biosynthesis/type III secretory pathway M-ring protein FliF/YscJ
MSAQWWVVLAVVVIIVAVIAYRRSRRAQESRAQERRMSVQRQSAAHSPAEEISQREDRRLGGMSAEDREWEQASLQQNRETQERIRRATDND